jgi:hypothetical protein
MTIEDIKYDPLRRMLISGTQERFVEDLDACEWLREKTEKRNWLEVAFFHEVAEHLNRVPTMDEYKATHCRYLPENQDVMEYILGERMGMTGDQIAMMELLIDPERLTQIAEARMGIKMMESRVAINFM